MGKSGRIKCSAPCAARLDGHEEAVVGLRRPFTTRAPLEAYKSRPRRRAAAAAAALCAGHRVFGARVAV